MLDSALIPFLKALASILFILAVLWCMWRIPGSPVIDSPISPWLALISTWVGIAAILAGLALWLAPNPEIAVVISVALWAGAISLGGLSLWIHRHTPPEQLSEALLQQRLQARTGIILGLIAVALWYLFILTHGAPT